MARHRLAALSDLSDGLGNLLSDAISPDRLKAMGWSAAGGAAGGLYDRLAIPQIMKLPLIGGLPAWGQGLLGAFLVGNASWNWNDSFARGAVGKLAGDAFTNLLDSLGLLSMIGAGSGTAYFGQPVAPDQLAPLDTTVLVPQSALAEVIQEGGIGYLGANVNPVSVEPVIQPGFDPKLGAFLS